jgi:hypothetical protein
MQKAFEIHAKVELSIEQLEDGPATYTERFAVPLGDEYDVGEVLAASIAVIEGFKRSMRKVGPAVRAGNALHAAMRADISGASGESTD